MTTCNFCVLLFSPPNQKHTESRSWRLSAKQVPSIYDGVSKSFLTACLKRELQMVQLSATRYSCVTILWVSLVSFATITFCVASQWVFIVVVYFVINSVWKPLDTSSYLNTCPQEWGRNEHSTRLTKSVHRNLLRG